jgi:hypothetical protein
MQTSYWNCGGIQCYSNARGLQNLHIPLCTRKGQYLHLADLIDNLDSVEHCGLLVDGILVLVQLVTATSQETASDVLQDVQDLLMSITPTQACDSSSLTRPVAK